MNRSRTRSFALVCLVFFTTLIAMARAEAGVPLSPAAEQLVLHRSFKPRFNPYGAFGGGDCYARRTPVIFLHGNGDVAGNWNSPSSNGGPSVIEQFRKAGYRDCEMFGITYLSNLEQLLGADNFHTEEKAILVGSFIYDVMMYTGAARVDIVAHSLGMTMAIHALNEGRLWNGVRKFIGISGAVRGISSCVLAGYANVWARTCSAQSSTRPGNFGFWPDGEGGADNPRMGKGPLGYARTPEFRGATTFYSIRAGIHDQFVCSGFLNREHCQDSSMFDHYRNVAAQILVGSGDEAPSGFEPIWTVDFFAMGGDHNGVGHLRSKTDTGALQLRMLTSDCQGKMCCLGYGGRCDVN